MNEMRDKNVNSKCEFVFLIFSPHVQIGKKDRSENLERAIEHMCRKTRDLRRQLRKAVVDHVSDR